jgi:FAD/FMN-containing dehydrogenase
MWTGDPAAADAAIAPLRSPVGAPSPSVDQFAELPYCAIQQWFDDGVPHGRRYHVRSEWLGDLDGDAADSLVECGATMSSPFNQVLVRPMGGAIADVAADATAFRFRDARYLLTIASGWNEGPDEPHVAWCRSSWERMLPWSSGGAYVNHLAADEGSERVREAYGAQTWARLVALKDHYDPANVFHLNQNVAPSSRG